MSEQAVQEETVENAENQEVEGAKKPDEGANESADGKDDGEEEPAKEEEKHRESRLQKRFDKLTREKHELKGRVDLLEKMVLENRQQAQPQEPPKREQFQSDGDFINALTDWKIDQRLAQQSQAPNPAWDAKVEATRAAHDDYDEVISDVGTIALPATANEAILSSDIGPEIIYHLGQNPNLALKISRMSAAAAAMEIGIVAAKLKSEAGAKENQKPKEHSKAPAPAKTVKPVGGSGPVDLYGKGAEKLSTKEWLEKRNAELAAKRK